jgi:metal-sulfur cluster biosynthetic enzyme
VSTAAPSAVAAPARADVLRALDDVRDPELDESVTALGFVASCEVAGSTAEVHLRLPTYFCAPNFAFLMVADAYDAVRSLPGIEETVVVLDDHFAADAINAGVAARAGFVGTFGDEASGELDELRADFVRKAVLAGTDRVCRPLLAEGEDVLAVRLGDLSPSPDLDRLRARRAELGLAADDAAPLLIDVVTGEPVSPRDLRIHLGRARLARVSIEANTGICRGMLAHRYGTTEEETQ